MADDQKHIPTLDEVQGILSPLYLKGYAAGIEAAAEVCERNATRTGDDGEAQQLIFAAEEIRALKEG